MQRRRPVMLAILDGWGWREDAADNAVKQARTPNFDRLWASCPHALLRTSGKDVGLPHGQMGNSEVGHLNIGAGRVVMQDLPRIGDAIASGEIEQQPALQDLIALPQGERRHLPSDGPGLAGRRAFASGSRGRPGEDPRRRRRADAWCTPGPTAAIRRRNRPATTSRASSRRCRSRSRSRPCAGATMRWTATSAGSASPRPMPPWSTPRARAFPTPAPSSTAAYAEKKFDEFIIPAVVGDYRGMRDGDGVLCFNFRADRVREILAAILDPEFSGFARKRAVKIACAVGMTQYSDELDTLHAGDLPAAVARRRSSARSSPTPAARSCAPPRPRNIRTSPISSTAAARSRFPARTASWCRRRRSRPTTCSRKCRRRS